MTASAYFSLRSEEVLTFSFSTILLGRPTCQPTCLLGILPFISLHILKTNHGTHRSHHRSRSGYSHCAQESVYDLRALEAATRTAAKRCRRLGFSCKEDYQENEEEGEEGSATSSISTSRTSIYRERWRRQYASFR